MLTTRITARKIPGLMPGIFFCGWLLAVGIGATPKGTVSQLGEELFAEGNWPAARVECWRVQHDGNSPDADRARMLAAICALRMNVDVATARQELAGLWLDESIALETRCHAAYEFGRAEWAAGNRAAAAASLKFAWQSTRDIPLFGRAGASLYYLLRADGDLRRRERGTWFTLQSCRGGWPPRVWRDCRPPPRARPSLLSLPGRAVVGFYRAMISPAIGARCDLEPSCSEYFRQASRAHGLLGIPIMADRFIREPSVVAAQEHPVVTSAGRIHYADPLNAHDYWLRRQK